MLKKNDLNGKSGEARRDQIVGGIAREISTGLEVLERALKRGKRGQEIPGVSIFGTARTGPDAPECKLAFELGSLLAESGFAVITGGGDNGVMSEGNRGGKKRLSIGVNISELPHEAAPNPYQDISLDHFYFEAREMMFEEFSVGYFILAGGLGTMREAFSVLTLIQCGHLEPAPVFFMDPDPAYWRNMLSFLTESQQSRGHIGQRDLDLFHITEDPVFAVSKVIEFCKEQHPGRFHRLQLPASVRGTAF